MQKNEIAFDCSMQEYDQGEIEEKDLVQLLIMLLDWGIESNQNTDQEKRIKLHMAVIKNQLILDFITGCGKGKLNRLMLTSCIKKYDPVMCIQKNAHEIHVQIMMKQ